MTSTANIMTTSPTTSNLHFTLDSLDLPRELIWDGKMEPSSPPSAVARELFALNESTVANWLYDDNFANGITLMNNDEPYDIDHTTSMELLSDEDLVVEFLDLKDEECLLDQKLSHYIDYDANNLQTIIDVVSQPIVPMTKVQAAFTELLPQGQDAQLEATAAVFAQLTPPQSPPQCSATYQQQPSVKEEQKASYSGALTTTEAAATPYNFNIWAGSQPASSSSSSNEIEREMQLVDEIVKVRAQELQLPNWQQYNDDCESQSSSAASLSGGSGGSICSAEEDWLPESSGSSPSYQGSSSGIDVDQASAPASPLASGSSSSTAAKKRTRPYGRGVEDRKIRKKEQNKNAATRYRQKKKLEMEHVLGEEQELSQENDSLRRTLAERRHELRYLRQLLREFYQGRKG